jgi:hypothetical protein
MRHNPLQSREIASRSFTPLATGQDVAGGTRSSQVNLAPRIEAKHAGAAALRSKIECHSCRDDFERQALRGEFRDLRSNCAPA